MSYKIETTFEEFPIERTVGAAGNSGRVYVPKPWVGKTVVIAVIPDKEQKAEQEAI